MVPGEIICARCGWQNELTARMCGGCGAPLRTPEPGSVNAYALPGATQAVNALPSAASFYSPEAPTTLTPTPPDVPAMGMPPRYGPPGAVGAWPGAAAPAAPQTKPHANGRRIAIITGAVLTALVIGLLGAWALIIQPALHHTVDTQLRNALSTAVSEVPRNAAAGTYAIGAGEVNAALQQLLPADAPIKNLQAQFSNGAIVFTYSFLGGKGSVTTQPYVNGGHLQAQGTTVNGLLSLFESGDQVQNAFNDALNGIPEQGKISSFTIRGNDIVLAVAG